MLASRRAVGGDMKSSELDVFVSYKSEDRARLKPLFAALEAEGFSIWWDAHIDGGTNWHEDRSGSANLDSALSGVSA